MPPIDIKQHLQAFHEVLEGLNTQLCMSNNGFMFFPALKLLEDTANTCVQDNDSWQYNLRPMRMKLPYKSKTIADDAKNIEIQLEVSNTIIIHPENEIKDSLSRLNFDIRIVSGELRAAWHLDKHSQVGNSDDGTNKYIHPEYHIAFGGEKMAVNDTGQIILLTSPRLMHPPMDVILGIDFIINQFIPYDYAKIFLTNKMYKQIVKDMKQLIWRPYFLAIAQHFQNNPKEKLAFDTDFSNKILGIRE